MSGSPKRILQVDVMLPERDKGTTCGQQLRLNFESVLVFDEARSRPQTMFLLAL